MKSGLALIFLLLFSASLSSAQVGSTCQAAYSLSSDESYQKFDAADLKRKELRSISPKRVSPLQGAVGMAEVRQKYRKMKAEAKRRAVSQGRPEAEMMRDILAREASDELRAFVDPDGGVHIDDSHHKTKAILMGLEEYNLSADDFPLSIGIAKENDFRVTKEGETREQKWQEFADRLDALGVAVTVAPEDQELSDSLNETTLDKLRRIAKTFNELSDSPMRSATGRLFDTIGLKGSQFKAMVQFEIGRQLAALNVQVPSGYEFSTATQGVLLEWMFGEKKNPDLQELLVSSALPAQRNLVRSALANAEARYNRLLKAIQAGTVFTEEDELDRAAFIEFYDISFDGVEDDNDYAKAAFMMLSFVADPARILPKSVLINRGKDASLEIYDMAVKRLKDSDPDEVQDLLSRIAKGKTGKLTRADFKVLKDFRKAILKVRSSFRYFGIGHKAPPDFDTYSRKLGKLNDIIARLVRLRSENAGDRKIAEAEDLLAGISKELIELMTKKYQKIRSGERPTLFTQVIEADSYKKTIAYHREQLDRIEKAISGQVGDSSSGYVLTVDEYHWIRRRIREEADVFQRLLMYDPNDVSVDIIYNLLNNLSHAMGEVKDGVLVDVDTRDLVGEVPGHLPTRLDPTSLSLIRSYLAVMRASLIDP